LEGPETFPRNDFPRFFAVEKLVEKFENSLEIKDKSCTFAVRKIMRTFLMY